MALQAYVPLNQVEGFRRRPIDDHGKLRFQYAKTVTAVGGDINSTFAVGKLPPGTCRVLPWLSRLTNSAWGAGCVLSVGHAAYRSKQDAAALNDGIEPINLSAFASAISVAGVNTAIAFSPLLLKYDIASTGGVDLLAQDTGAVVPVAATLETLIAYIYE